MRASNSTMSAFDCPQHHFGVRHLVSSFTAGCSHEKRTPIESAALILSSIDIRRRRANSWSRDRVAQALRRGWCGLCMGRLIRRCAVESASKITLRPVNTSGFQTISRLPEHALLTECLRGGADGDAHGRDGLGKPRWRLRLGSPCTALCQAGDGVAVALENGALCWVNAAGAVTHRARLPALATHLVTCGHGAVLAGDGRLALLRP